MSVTPESLRALLKLAEMDAHEPVARRWAEGRTGLLRVAFADAYRQLVGVHPRQRGTLREVLEAVRDGAAGGEVSVAGAAGRPQVNGESGGDS